MTIGSHGHVWPCPRFYVGNWDGDRPRARCTRVVHHLGDACPVDAADLPDSPVRARLDVMNEIVEGIRTGRLEVVERRQVVINGVTKIQLVMDVHDV